VKKETIKKKPTGQSNIKLVGFGRACAFLMSAPVFWASNHAKQGAAPPRLAHFSFTVPSGNITDTVYRENTGKKSAKVGTAFIVQKFNNATVGVTVTLNVSQLRLKQRIIPPSPTPSISSP